MTTQVDKDACDLLDADHLAVRHLFLQLRVRKHVDMVAKLKAECDQQREQSALAK